MADVKITTPDGKVPSSPSPVEGKDYTIVGGPLSDGDLILRDGKIFMQYQSPKPEPGPSAPVDPMAGVSAAIAALASDIKAIKQKVGA